MLLNFNVSSTEFKCTDTEVASNAVAIDYLKLHFNFKDSFWSDVDALYAVVKNATYNVTDKAMLDSDNSCLINREVFQQGGLIQVKLLGDKYVNDTTIISTTHTTPTAEFLIRENMSTPTRIPTHDEVFIAELNRTRQAVLDAIDEIKTKANEGYFDGEDGVGIANIVYNANGTVTVTLTDGTSFTSSQSMKGETGAAGTDGVGISNIAFGQDGTMVITMSDGTQYTTPYSVIGPQGERGPEGEKGDTGDAGADGILYGTCTTSDSTQAKTVDISGIDELVGVRVIAVDFTHRNTALRPTLNVNGLGAHEIVKGSPGLYAPYTTRLSTEQLASVLFGTQILRYDGSHWIVEERQSQSDWEQDDAASPEFIKNKPTLFNLATTSVRANNAVTIPAKSLGVIRFRSTATYGHAIYGFRDVVLKTGSGSNDYAPLSISGHQFVVSAGSSNSVSGIDLRVYNPTDSAVTVTTDSFMMIVHKS